MKMTTQIQKMYACRSYICSAIGVTGGWKFQSQSASATPGTASAIPRKARRQASSGVLAARTSVSIPHHAVPDHVLPGAGARVRAGPA